MVCGILFLASFSAGFCGTFQPVENRLEAQRHGCLVYLDRVRTIFALNRDLVLEAVSSRLRGADYGWQVKESSRPDKVGNCLGFLRRHLIGRNALCLGDTCETAAAFEHDSHIFQSSPGHAFHASAMRRHLSSGRKSSGRVRAIQLFLSSSRPVLLSWSRERRELGSSGRNSDRVPRLNYRLLFGAVRTKQASGDGGRGIGHGLKIGAGAQ